VARNECHRRLRSGSLHASIEEAPEVTDEAADVAADVERADLHALVRAAAAGTGSITLTASGGSVTWSVSEPPGLANKVVVAPVSGTLAAGETATVTVTVAGPGKPRVHLTFSPGGATVTVVIG